MGNTELIMVHLMNAFAIILPTLIMKSMDKAGSEPNKLVGYRTKASMRSNETWFYAQKRSADLMVYSVYIVLSVQVLSFVFLNAQTSIIVMTSTLVAAIIVMMVVVEVELRKKFDKEGKPKSNTIIRGD
uniref:SdpI family protein n=1 Tax=Roseivirga sp. TaxID=1964215 RepID=UPI004048297D